MGQTTRKGAWNGGRAFGMGAGHSGWGRCSEQEQDAWNRDRALGIETGLLRTNAGKAVRGAVSEMCEALERHDRAV